MRNANDIEKIESLANGKN